MDGHLQVTMDDGSIHAMPWRPIRHSYRLCYNFAVSEPSMDELAEWFGDSMTWQEVSPHLVEIEKAKPDYQQAFCDGDFTSQASTQT